VRQLRLNSRVLLFAVVAALVLASCGGAGTQSPSPTVRPTVAATTAGAAATPVADRTPCAPIAAGIATKTATLELANGGVVKMALRSDKAPSTVATFVAKASSGFYNGLTFHRVVADFVVQGGDPLGNGTGGGNQPTELNDLPFCVGALGIARGTDIKVSNDSQWFICIGVCRFLDKMYTNFGQVTSGMDVASGIKVGDKIKSLTIQ
jgi:cyclophilin family peptidyl-prolyl cis-trans isomerase